MAFLVSMARLFISLFRSVCRAVTEDPEMRTFVRRHPAFFQFIRKRLTPDETFGLGLTLGVGITSFFIYLFFGLARNIVGEDTIIESDTSILNLVQLLRTSTLDQWMLLFTYMGTWQIVAIGVLLLGVFLFIFRRRYYFIALAASVGIGEIFVQVIHTLFERARPSLVSATTHDGFLYIGSGHTFVGFSFYALLAYVLYRMSQRRVLRIASILFGILCVTGIAFSRVYLGLQWPADVFASFASAAAWVTILITVLEMRRKAGSEIEEPLPFKSSTRLIFGAALCAAWLISIALFYSARPLALPTPIREVPRVIIESNDFPTALFTGLPRVSETLFGKPTEPINIIVVGKEDAVRETFKRAGWAPSDPLTPQTLWRVMIASLLDKPYTEAPGTPTFWNTRPNDFAYQKSTSAQTVRERHHIHFWKTSLVTERGDHVWLCTAHFDQGIKLKTRILFPTHKIDPAVDKERDTIKDDLLRTGSVRSLQEFRIVEPTLGKNLSGDQFFTDGRSYVVFLK